MGKEAKIGLAVISILLIVFGVVLFQRLNRSPEDPAAAAAESDGKKKPEEKKLDLGGPSLTNTKPKVVAARPGSGKSTKPSQGSLLDDWSVASDATAKKPATGKKESPPSFMPTLAGAGPGRSPTTPASGDRYGTWSQQGAPAAGAATPQAQAGQRIGPFTSNALLNSVRSTQPQAGPAPMPNAGYRQDGAGHYAAGQYRTPDYNHPSYPTYRTGENPYRTPRSGGSMSQPVDVGQAIAKDGTYTVQPSDNYWTISERLYGTYFCALAEHNKKFSPAADELMPGEKIAAPSVAELEKNYRGLCPKPEHREVADKRMSMVSTVSHIGTGRAYVVQEGDTLFDIAKHELGKAGRWAEIYQLNRDALGEQYDYLTPGMELALPGDQRQPEMITAHPGSSLLR